MTAARFFPPSPPGSLLKGANAPRRKDKHEPRERDEEHLELVRLCSCVGCGRRPAGEAMHIRLTRFGKPITGMGLKPSDRYTLPGCHECHMTSHREGEVTYYEQLGIDPLKTADDLYAASPDGDKMEAVIINSFATRE